MSEEPINLVLEHLRAIRFRQDSDGEMLREMNDRLTRVEIGISHLRRDQALDSETVAHMGARLDRLRLDVDRIKVRLDLREA